MAGFAILGTGGKPLDDLSADADLFLG